MKITLINPVVETKQVQPPVGLLHVAAAVRAWTDFSVEILDANFLSDREIFVKARNSDVIGVGATTFMVAQAIKTLHPFKEAGITTVLGGPHVSIVPVETLKRFSAVDIGVIGEGELTLVELLKCLQNDNSLGGVQGIVWRKDGEIVLNEPRPNISDLDILPFPDYNLVKEHLKKYSPLSPVRWPLPYMGLLLGRGCPHRCVFCCPRVWGKQYRAFSPEYFIKHLERLRNLGIKSLHFYDDTLTIDRQRIMEICKLIRERQLDFSWSCETRVNLVDKELLIALKRAGCGSIAFGLESGCQRVLDVLKKDITIEQSRNAVKWASEAGMSVVGYMILGSPTETEEEIRQSIEFTKSLPLDLVQWSIFTPYIGTESYNKLREEGRLDDQPWDGVGYSVLHQKGRIVTANENLTPEQLISLSKEAYKTFYFRSSYILRRMWKSCHSLRELKASFQGLLLLAETFKRGGDVA